MVGSGGSFLPRIAAACVNRGRVNRGRSSHGNIFGILTTKSNEVASGAGSSYTYAVNQLEQRTQVSQAGSAFATAQSIEWGYDPLGQVAEADHSADTWGGDRCEQASIGDRSEATCPQGQKRRNAFFDQNRLLSTTEASNSATAQYEYDYLSRRVKKAEGADTTTYLYEGWNPVLQTKNGTEQTRYSWGMDLSGSMQGAGGVGGLLSVHQSNGLSGYPTYDGNGSVSEYLDTAGATTAHYEYDAFGKTTVKTGTQADNFEHRFSTKSIESESGLYYYGYRYYDPQTGRWPSRDSIEEEGGINLYGFVFNSPISWIDVLGNAPKSVSGGGGFTGWEDDKGNSETGVFKDRAGGRNNSNVTDINVGQDIINHLKKLSKQKPNCCVKSYTLSGHGWAEGRGPGVPSSGSPEEGFVEDKKGFPGAGKGIADLSDLTAAISSGDIKFCKPCTINVYACRIADSFIQKLASATGCKVTASAGACRVKPGTNNTWQTNADKPGDSNQFRESDGGKPVQDVGQTFNP